MAHVDPVTGDERHRHGPLHGDRRLREGGAPRRRDAGAPPRRRSRRRRRAARRGRRRRDHGRPRHRPRRVRPRPRRPRAGRWTRAATRPTSRSRAPSSRATSRRSRCAAASRCSTSRSAARSSSTSTTTCSSTATTSMRTSVTIEPGSRLAAVVGTTSLGVNTLHHQVLAGLGDGVRVVARNEDGARRGHRGRRRAATCSRCSGTRSCSATVPSTSRCSPTSPTRARRPAMARVLVPLPDADFDVTEVAVPWHVLTDAGHEVVFATERGATPAADPRLLDRRDLRPARRRRRAQAALRGHDARPSRSAHRSRGTRSAPTTSTRSCSPAVTRRACASTSAAPRCSAGSAELWALERPVGAICHGVLVLARTVDPATGRSVLADRTTTCLPKYMERSAYAATAWKLGRYYRTYPAYVEDEVRAALRRPGPAVPARAAHAVAGGAPPPTTAARFVVEDGRYVSARWPGDAYAFARASRTGLEPHERRTTVRRTARVRPARAAVPTRHACVGGRRGAPPRLTRVTLSRARSSSASRCPEPAGSVRLLLPEPDGLEIPTWAGNNFVFADGRRPTLRTLTPVGTDPGPGSSSRSTSCSTAPGARPTGPRSARAGRRRPRSRARHGATSPRPTRRGSSSAATRPRSPRWCSWRRPSRPASLPRCSSRSPIRGARLTVTDAARHHGALDRRRRRRPRRGAGRRVRGPHGRGRHPRVGRRRGRGHAADPPSPLRDARASSGPGPPHGATGSTGRSASSDG